jgi:hypothetical protein
MDIGTPVDTATGGGGEIHGRGGSSFLQSISSFMPGATPHQSITPPEMKVGTPIQQLTGGHGEVHAGNSDFGRNMAFTMTGLGVFALVDKLTEPTPVPQPTQEEVRMAAIAQDEQRIAEIGKEEAQKQEALAKEEARKRAFSKPKM